MKKTWRVLAASLVALAATQCRAAAPPTTLIEDMLYRADGTRYDGLLQIQWRRFRAGNGVTIPDNTTTVRVINGYFRIALVPTTNAITPTYYTVRYSSDNRGELTEFWSVPPSATPLTVSDIRTDGPIASPIVTPPTSVAIQDVSGLRTELDLRPMRGTSWAPSKTAVIGSAGALDGAIGLPGDCVHVDGSSGPCGSLDRLFVDADVPSGTIDGVNTVFTLSAAPAPAVSLTLFRNGMLQRQGTDYTLSGRAVQLAPGRAPNAGDTLRAWYRVVDATSTVAWSDAEAPAGAIDGANRVFTLSEVPMPAASLQVYRNGLLQSQGLDYQLSVNTITFLEASTPQAGDTLLAIYRK